jgi:endonuclease/exonuclease/phosphatase family metal-dependent hydrolase
MSIEVRSACCCCTITLDKTITFCSVYIPPNSALGLAQLKNLADQLPTPFIIMGDFNGHNPLWGSKITTDKGKKLEDFLSQVHGIIFKIYIITFFFKCVS